MGHIRAASFGDIEDLLRLYGYLGNEKLDLHKAKEIFEKINQNTDYTIYLYHKGDKVLGTASLIIIPNLAHGGRPIAVVENMVVEPGYRNRGIGTALFMHVMEQAVRDGCYKLMLSSNLSRKKAHGFYKKMGLKRHGYSFMIGFDS